MKKVYYALKLKDNKDKFFAGQREDGSLILVDKNYYLYNYKMAKAKLKSMEKKDLFIIESPVQDVHVWDEPNPWETKPKK
jgi:hypothetical protein